MANFFKSAAPITTLSARFHAPTSAAQHVVVICSSKRNSTPFEFSMPYSKCYVIYNWKCIIKFKDKFSLNLTPTLSIDSAWHLHNLTKKTLMHKALNFLTSDSELSFLETYWTSSNDRLHPYNLSLLLNYKYCISYHITANCQLNTPRITWCTFGC